MFIASLIHMRSLVLKLKKPNNKIIINNIYDNYIFTLSIIHLFSFLVYYYIYLPLFHPNININIAERMESLY